MIFRFLRWLFAPLKGSTLADDSTVELEAVDVPPAPVADRKPITISSELSDDLYAAKRLLDDEPREKQIRRRMLQEVRLPGDLAEMDDEVKLVTGEVGVVVGIAGDELSVLSGSRVIRVGRKLIEYVESCP